MALGNIYNFKLIARGRELDLYEDEVIFLSNNITGLFDVGQLPSDFTRQIKLPATRGNNAFFEHVYDISIESPYLFESNTKVIAQFEISGYYIAQVYIQLNKVNLIDNKVRDYEVTVFGLVSSFSRDLRGSTLNELTELENLNHISNYENILYSWSGSQYTGNEFTSSNDGTSLGGRVVYALVDSGQSFKYQAAIPNGIEFGIDTFDGGLNVSEFKPMVRVKEVVDAIFTGSQYTYESDFFTQSWLDDVYVLCDRGLQIAKYNGLDLDTYGKWKLEPISGSSTDTSLTNGTYTQLPWNNNTYDPQGFVKSDLSILQPRTTQIRGKIKLQFKVSGSSGYPQFYLGPHYSSSGVLVENIELEGINGYLQQYYSNQTSTGEKEFVLEQEWVTAKISSGSDLFYKIKYEEGTVGPMGSDTQFEVTMSAGGNTDSYIESVKLAESADYRAMDIPLNMPYGEDGITQLEFIQMLQKKWNLIIQPQKNKPRHFKIETCNKWYKEGKTKDLNAYIRTDKPFVVTPANNLAVKKLQFGDKLDEDYLAQEFKKVNNREYGKSIYEDTQNFFSEGEFKVEPQSSVSPLLRVAGSGVEGADGDVGGGYAVLLSFSNFTSTACTLTPTTYYISANRSYIQAYDIVYQDSQLTTPVTGYNYASDGYDIFVINTSNGTVIADVGNCTGGGGPTS